ncbi:MAG: calcium-translocating P-type ATPase, PMCA-type [Gemmataceae bacterium]
MRTLAEVKQALGTSAEAGLSPSEVEKSLSQFGANRLTPLPREPLWKKFLGMFEDPIIKILLAAALLSMIVDLFRASANLGLISLIGVVVILVGSFVVRQQQWLPSLMFGLAVLLFFFGLGTGHFLVEGMAVMIAVILATGVAFLSEYRSDREFELLNAQKEDVQVKVIRGGQFQTIKMDDVVVGDVVQLEMGDEIPADGRVLTAKELQIDQSLMTGESEAVRKLVRPDDEADSGPGHPGSMYRGTQVVDGAGTMLVTEVGDNSELGKIARKLSATEVEEEEDESASGEEKRIKAKLTISKDLTPLQLKLTKLAEQISLVGYIAALAIFVAQLVYGIVSSKVYIPGDLDQTLEVFSQLLSYFVNMVIIIVVAVPEGLPMSVTISLALAMQKMTRANSLVRKLVACETVGSANVICSDKTGTLTQNKMRVERLIWEGQIYDRGQDGWGVPEKATPWPRDNTPINMMAINSAVNSTAYLERKEGKLLTVGNATEGALLQYIEEGGIDYNQLRKDFEAKYQLHFSADRKRMLTVIDYGDRMISLVKGAPEILLERSTHYLKADGSVEPWNDEARDAVQKSLNQSAVEAMRTLAFAYRDLPADMPTTEDELHERRDDLETNLTFVGMVSIRDPLRDDVPAAIDRCRDAGIKIKMVTGDNVETARAIAHKIHLIDNAEEPINSEKGVVMTSSHFQELFEKDREGLKEKLPNLRVLARALPGDKYRLVTMLQELNEVVAVTGDGTNDAPALKKADVGLAMGIAGTEVAKEASDIVLLDDSFSTIVSAVKWGRSLYDNIQRFIQFQLTINFSALVIFFLGVFLGVEAPFTVLQLLWINVIMDTFAAIALCSEPPRDSVMDLPPKKKDESIISPAMLKTILGTGTFFIVVMLSMMFVMKGGPSIPPSSHVPGQWAFHASDEEKKGPWSVERAGSRFEMSSDELSYSKEKEQYFFAHKKGESEKEMLPLAYSETQKQHYVPLEDGKKAFIQVDDREDKKNPRRFYEVEEGDDQEVNYAFVDTHFTVLQVSLFFSLYVFFQVWNQINCRSLTPRESGMTRIWENPTFLAIAGTVAIGQIIIVTVGGSVFKVQPLSVVQWLVIIGATASVLVFAEIARFVQLAMLNSSQNQTPQTAATPTASSEEN